MGTLAIDPFPSVRLPILSRFMGYTPTPLAFQEWIPLFYPHNRQEKDRDVVIHPFELGLVKSTGGASPGLAIEIYGLWLNSPNEEEHDSLH